MKTFSDLEFNNISFGIRAIMEFENGYGVSVARFILGTRDIGCSGFGLAVIKSDSSGIFHLCYDSGITDDVIRNLTADEVTELMSKVQKLKKD